MKNWSFYNKNLFFSIFPMSTTLPHIYINMRQCCVHILFWKPPWNFSFFYFTPGNSRQNKAQPLDIPQNCVRSLGNSKAKNKDPWVRLTFHITFILLWLLVTLGNSTSFLINPWKFQIIFLWFPGNSISSTPLFGFFLE